MCEQCDEDYFYYIGRYKEKAQDKDIMANLLFECTTSGDDIEYFISDYWQNQHTYEWNLQEFRKVFGGEIVGIGN